MFFTHTHTHLPHGSARSSLNAECARVCQRTLNVFLFNFTLYRSPRRDTTQATLLELRNYVRKFWGKYSFLIGCRITRLRTSSAFHQLLLRNTQKEPVSVVIDGCIGVHSLTLKPLEAPPLSAIKDQ